MSVYVSKCVLAVAVAVAAAAAVTAAPSNCQLPAEKPQRSAAAAGAPTVLLIVADDVGWNDVGFTNGNPAVSTPNLDRLAAHGVTLDQFYGVSVAVFLHLQV